MAEPTFRAILLPAKNHFEQTIQNTVSASLLAEFLPEKVATGLASQTGVKGVPTWGLTPGANGQHVAKWDKLRAGDYGIFTGQGTAFAFARLIGKEHNASLARRLWGEDEQGMTWEYLLFFQRVISVSP